MCHTLLFIQLTALNFTYRIILFVNWPILILYIQNTDMFYPGSRGPPSKAFPWIVFLFLKPDLLPITPVANIASPPRFTMRGPEYSTNYVS